MKAIKLFKLFGTLFLCFLTASYSYADKIRAPKYDFSVVNKSNQQLYFQILSQAEHTVAITKAPHGYRDDEYVFPEKVEYRGVVYDVVAVADKAFYEQDDLDNIVLPKTIRSIGYHAFEDCRFSSFYFPDSLKEVNEGAFDNTIIEDSGLANILPNLVGKYYTKPLAKGGYRLYKATRHSVSFKNDVTGVINEYSDLRNLEQILFEKDLVSYYQPILTKVERTNDPENRYSGLKEVQVDQVSWFKFGDEFIDLSIKGTVEQFDLIIRNKSANTIKIIWDDAVFVNVDGNTSKVMHKGVKYVDRESSQGSSTIIRGSSLSDIIIPNVFVYYDESLKTWTSWAYYPEDSSYEGKTVTIMLPVQIKDVINEYLLEFTLLYLPLYPERLNNYK